VADPACGGETVWNAYFDLDAHVARPGYSSVGGRPRRALALSVGHKPTIVEFWAATRKYTVGWEAKVYYSVGLADKTLVITDGGHPFWVTSELRSAAYTGGLSRSTSSSDGTPPGTETARSLAEQVGLGPQPT
jgi:hypothetical protein